MNFVQFCEDHGLVMGRLIEGRWVRVKTTDKMEKRNGAYRFLGDHGFVQNHATMTEVAVWHADATVRVQPVNEAEQRARRDAERAARVQAMRSARAFWNNARPLNRPHPYIERKGLSPLGCAGLRTHDGLLVVPVVHGDWIISVQTITADGVKRFWPGAPVKAGAYVLQRPRSAVTAIVEGLATGLAVYQAIRHASVIVAFDAGNLFPVVERLRPTGSVVIVADNDHGTQAKRGMNPGREKAANAAELIDCGVWWPEGIEGTDAADFVREIGEGAGKKLERQILAKARYVTPSTAAIP